MTEAVYIIYEREFINSTQNVYKIGRTSQSHAKRFNSYPKGSILKIQKQVKNSAIIETKIKEIFNQKFKLRRDIGVEYFEGDYNEMENVFIQITNEDNEDNENIDDKDNENIDDEDNENMDDEDNENLKEIKTIFPSYNEDICFGGGKKLVKISIINKKTEYSSSYYYTITCRYIDSCCDGSKFAIFDECIDTYHASAQNGQKYFDKLIRYGILENEKTYDLNDKRVLKSFNKYKTKINNCFLNNEDRICHKKIIAQEIFISETIGKIIFSDTLINNVYYVDEYNITKKSFDVFLGHDSYTDSKECHKSFMKINSKHIDISYLRQYLPYVFEIYSNNDAYIINREYEYISLSTKSLNTPEKCINRIYLYNDGCKPWDNIKNFQTVLSKFKELKKNNEIVNMCDITLMLLNIFPNM